MITDEEVIRLKEANRKMAAGLNKYSRHLYHDCLYKLVITGPSAQHWEHRGALKECRCGLAQLLLEISQ